MDVSVIIVNYNTKELTMNCIENIRRSILGIDYEIILVDNASTDGSKEFFDNFNDIVYIYNDQNLGFGKANNIGARKAKGKYLFLINTDTIMLNNAPGMLFAIMEKDSKVGVLGVNILTKDYDPNVSYSLLFPSIFSEFLYSSPFNILYKALYGYKRFYNLSRKPLKVAFVNGACMMVSKKLFDAMGGFDPGFFMYFEETDLERRISKAGYKVLNIPEAKIIHLEGGSFNFKPAREKLYFESRKFYFIKQHSRLYYKIATMLYISYLTIGMFMAKFSNKAKYDLYAYRLKILKELN